MTSWPESTPTSPSSSFLRFILTEILARKYGPQGSPFRVRVRLSESPAMPSQNQNDARCRWVVEGTVDPLTAFLFPESGGVTAFRVVGIDLSGAIVPEWISGPSFAAVLSHKSIRKNCPLLPEPNLNPSDRIALRVRALVCSCHYFSVL
jgi:hypothetical protein